MEWKKAPQWLVEAFANLVPADPAVERRQMFGYPAAFANGNMFIGVHQENLVLRLPETDRERFVTRHAAEVFSPMPGRPMREYLIVPHDLVRRPAELAPWIALSLRYAATLPPKAAAKAAAKKESAAKTAARERKKAGSR
ncbi:MAG TPA: TfoX/Sxy family protein [Thermoanaerobaculia bacterium]|nr:TfoX/Sxy family protein [Thermoanaerobaculia bacterium]